MTKPAHLDPAEYAAFEESIASDRRGRAFLRQRDRRSRLVAMSEVRRLLNQMMIQPQSSAAMVQRQADHIRFLRQELVEMSSFIQQTRQEIADLSPEGSGNSRILSATGELDAIVSATERATLEILKGAERIGAAVARLPKSEATDAVRAEIEAQIMEIMTSCSFQDITGQRTSKVVNTLRYIEQRVHSMMQMRMGEAMDAPEGHHGKDGRPDAHLLNGPALEGGVSQGDIDALFN
jgi:hypothetical protein